MTTSVRRRTAMVALALSLAGSAALAANTALHAPTADGGLPGPIITTRPPVTKPPVTRPPITQPPITIEPWPPITISPPPPVE